MLGHLSKYCQLMRKWWQHLPWDPFQLGSFFTAWGCLNQRHFSPFLSLSSSQTAGLWTLWPKLRGCFVGLSGVILSLVCFLLVESLPLPFPELLGSISLKDLGKCGENSCSSTRSKRLLQFKKAVSHFVPLLCLVS